MIKINAYRAMNKIIPSKRDNISATTKYHLSFIIKRRSKATYLVLFEEARYVHVREGKRLFVTICQLKLHSQICLCC